MFWKRAICTNDEENTNKSTTTPSAMKVVARTSIMVLTHLLNHHEGGSMAVPTSSSCHQTPAGTTSHPPTPDPILLQMHSRILSVWRGLDHEITRKKALIVIICILQKTSFVNCPFGNLDVSSNDAPPPLSFHELEIWILFHVPHLPVYWPAPWQAKWSYSGPAGEEAALQRASVRDPLNPRHRLAAGLVAGTSSSSPLETRCPQLQVKSMRRQGVRPIAKRVLQHLPYAGS